jgi:hypothetical protein
LGQVGQGVVHLGQYTDPVSLGWIDQDWSSYVKEQQILQNKCVDKSVTGGSGSKKPGTKRAVTSTVTQSSKGVGVIDPQDRNEGVFPFCTGCAQSCYSCMNVWNCYKCGGNIESCGCSVIEVQAAWDANAEKNALVAAKKGGGGVLARHSWCRQTPFLVLVGQLVQPRQRWRLMIWKR